jgi:predicted protein tyrosine phosphatase
MASLEADDHDFVISLIAPDEDRCQHRGEHHLIARFDDAEVAEIEHEGKLYRGPTREQIQEILDWAMRIPGDASLLVHCTAGKSRSTAVAMAVLIQLGRTPEQALQLVVEARAREGGDILGPNRLIVRYADEHMALDGEFIRLIDRFYLDLSRRIPLELLKRGRHTPEA